ncbi:MAG: FG-GAP-like repeat-containing protein [Terriglobales bacterium]
MNGDGKLDLVVVMQCDGSSCLGPGPISVLLGNGDGTFHLATAFSSGYFVTVADVNGDGKPDLLLADIVDNSANVLLGNGDGTFQGVVEYPPGGLVSYSIAVADVNGDGKPDLVVANECGVPCGTSGITGVLLGNGDGAFQKAVSFGSGGVFAHSVAVADVNGDGKLDLLVANCGNTPGDCQGKSIGTIGVLINNGKPGTATSLASSQNPSDFGQAVTLTAAVTAPGGGTPTGTVSFLDGTTKIGDSNLNGSAVATLTTSTLAEGTHSITATYNGDANFGISTSPVLDQVVEGATVTLSPASLNFGAQTAGITSAPQVVMLTNTGAVPLILTSINISGTNVDDFAQTNNCPSSIAPNGSCNISVTFTPTAGGNRNAAVSIADNAPGSPQDVPLTGIVPDFSVTANSPTSQTVTPGQAANFVVTVAPINGFAETVSLSCSGAPAQSTCAVTPSSVILNGSSTVAVNVAVVTAGVSTALKHPPQLPTGMRWALGLALSPVAGLVVLGGLGSMRRHRHLLRPLALLAIFLASLAWPACGGGANSSGGGTAVGSYNLTVTGAYTSGSVTMSHATKLTLIVQ